MFLIGHRIILSYSIIEQTMILILKDWFPLQQLFIGSYPLFILVTILSLETVCWNYRLIDYLSWIIKDYKSFISLAFIKAMRVFEHSQQFYQKDLNFFVVMYLAMLKLHYYLIARLANRLPIFFHQDK